MANKLALAHERAKLKNRADILATRTRIAEHQSRLKVLRENAKQFKSPKKGV
jgi:hypothetical protein